MMILGMENNLDKRESKQWIRKNYWYVVYKGLCLS